jgi:hypothetical protein
VAEFGGPVTVGYRHKIVGPRATHRANWDDFTKAVDRFQFVFAKVGNGNAPKLKAEVICPIADACFVVPGKVRLSEAVT